MSTVAIVVLTVAIVIEVIIYAKWFKEDDK